VFKYFKQFANREALNLRGELRELIELGLGEREVEFGGPVVAPLAQNAQPDAVAPVLHIFQLVMANAGVLQSLLQLGHVGHGKVHLEGLHAKVIGFGIAGTKVAALRDWELNLANSFNAFNSLLLM